MPQVPRSTSRISDAGVALHVKARTQRHQVREGALGVERDDAQRERREHQVAQFGEQRAGKAQQRVGQQQEHRQRRARFRPPARRRCSRSGPRAVLKRSTIAFSSSGHADTGELGEDQQRQRQPGCAGARTRPPPRGSGRFCDRSHAGPLTARAKAVPAATGPAAGQCVAARGHAPAPAGTALALQARPPARRACPSRSRPRCPALHRSSRSGAATSPAACAPSTNAAMRWPNSRSSAFANCSTRCPGSRNCTCKAWASRCCIGASSRWWRWPVRAASASRPIPT